MKKVIALLLVSTYLLSLAGCQSNQPDFEDFPKYEDDFSIIKDFLVDYCFTRNDASPFSVDLGSDFLALFGNQNSDSTVEDSVKAVCDKGFTIVQVEEDCIVFWKDETRHYGVLWSQNPKDAINQMAESARPYMDLKSRKLAEEWYEIGALDAI